MSVGLVSLSSHILFDIVLRLFLEREKHPEARSCSDLFSTIRDGEKHAGTGSYNSVERLMVSTQSWGRPPR